MTSSGQVKLAKAMSADHHVTAGGDSALVNCAEGRS